MSQVSEYILMVGEYAPVRRGILTSYSVVYAGLVGDSTYSVVVTVFSSQCSMAYNLYLPRGQREIELPKGRLDVLSVSPEEMRFTYYG